MPRRSISTSAWATPSATAPAPTSAARSSAPKTAHTILGNHDAAVAGPHGLLVLLPRGPPRARPARPARSSPTTCVAQEPALRGARGRGALLPRLAAEHRGVRLHLRARSGRAVPGDLGPARAAHPHRPLAPVQVVRAVARRRSTRWSPTASSCARGGTTSSASARSGSRATTIRAPATRSTTPRAKPSSSSASSYDIKTSAEKIFNSDLEPNFGHRLFIGV